MAAFAFKAVNARGKNTNGVLEGDNARQVRQQLREKGLIPLEVEHKVKAKAYHFLYLNPVFQRQI